MHVILTNLAMLYVNRVIGISFFLIVVVIDRWMADGSRRDIILPGQRAFLRYLVPPNLAYMW